MPFFRCKVSAPAKICFYSCFAVVRFLRLLKHVSMLFVCDVGWLEWIPLHLVWGRWWLRQRTWLATFTTSLPCGDGIVWSWCSWWVNVKSWCSWCYNKFLYIVRAVIHALLHNFIHCWSTLLCFVRSLEHFDIHCWNNYLYAYTQFYTLLVCNSIYCWDTILYIVGVGVCTFLHNCVHYYNTIPYIVGAHFYLMLEHISIHYKNCYPYIVGRLLYIVGWYFYPCSWH